MNLNNWPWKYSWDLIGSLVLIVPGILTQLIIIWQVVHELVIDLNPNKPNPNKIINVRGIPGTKHNGEYSEYLLM